MPHREHHVSTSDHAVVPQPASLANETRRAIGNFTNWLARYGETSFDHQSFFAGPFGRRAKALYYKNKGLGTVAVAPMIFLEAFVPIGRKLFHQPMRFPIADAHYAMGFAFLYEAGGNPDHLTRALHFLNVLKHTRCPGFAEYCWGYPFGWVTRNGTIPAQTPLITSTPYMYEAFLQCDSLAGGVPEWQAIMASIAGHAANDIKDFPTSADAASCSYTPYDAGGVVNAAAYRGFLLTSASRFFGVESYADRAQRNVNFVLDSQNPDGSWPYAMDGVRDFVDHFHTCFVMKALAKTHTLTGHERTLAALAKGVDFYLANLFDEEGLPRPFAKAPRLTVYRRELYDCAECINLCLLLRDRFPQLNAVLERVVRAMLRDWVKANGSFRSRQLIAGWDNVPMHRWAQSQMFRSLAFFVYAARSSPSATATGAREHGETFAFVPAAPAR